jgi:four helix bundle protein
MQIAKCGDAWRMPTNDLRQRTKSFALEVIKLIDRLPPGRTTDVVGRQLLRSATSVGANYRAACMARSRADFISKMGIVQEEVDESVYWIEILTESGIVQADKLGPLKHKGIEILSMAISSIETARKNQN